MGTGRRAVRSCGTGCAGPGRTSPPSSSRCRPSGYEQIEDLLGDGYEIVHQAERDGEVVGVALASRWPIEAVHELPLNVSDRTAASLDVTLAAEIAAPEPIGRLLFMAANPKWEMGYERERELQALIAARFAERYARRA